MSMRCCGVLVIVLLYSVCEGTNHSGRGNTSSTENKAQAAVVEAGSGQSKVRSLISLFASSKRDERESSRRDLIEFAKVSAENRRIVIETLQEAVGRLNLHSRLVLDEPTFLTFLGACQVLGKLQATEAIDLLIRFIYCSDGHSGEGVGHRPAENALISIGVKAVPQLRESLLDRSDKTATAEVRKIIIVRCLANIGGEEAKQTLEEAKHSETDKNLLEHIEAAIATIQRTPAT